MTSSEKLSFDSALKPYDEMLLGEFREGMLGYERSATGLFVSSISAGIDLSFSLMLLAIAHSMLQGVDELPARFITASLYPIGFIFVILGRAELFTEQTTLAIVPVLHGRASLQALGRLWGIVYVGNLIGIALMVAVYETLGPALHIFELSDLETVAERLIAPGAGSMLLSAAVAGWLMGLLSWLLTATRDTISQIVLVWLIATMIGVGELHHSILGAGEVLAGVVSGSRLTVGDLLRFLLWATLGNIIGAVVFAGLLKVSEGARGKRIRQMDKASHTTNQQKGLNDPKAP